MTDIRSLLSRKRGQTNIIVAVIVIAVFITVIVALMSLLKTAPSSDYINIYVHNLLISTLRADTGYLEPSCKTVEDAIACVYTEPITYLCGDKMSCRQLADEKIGEYMTRNTFLGRKYRYLFDVTMGGRPSLSDSPLQFGDQRLQQEKVEKTSADVTIQKITRSGKALAFNIRLLVSAEK